jgi:hypothetical protein
MFFPFVQKSQELVAQCKEQRRLEVFKKIRHAPDEKTESEIEVYVDKLIENLKQTIKAKDNEYALKEKEANDATVQMLNDMEKQLQNLRLEKDQ